jgi:uncharacterized DUF497 family protein
VRYTWDIRKDEENRRKHRVRLSDGITALADPDRLEWIDDRFAYGEERNVTLGMAGSRLLLVVHAQRSLEVVRIISVRRATRLEQKAYRERDVASW